MQDHQQSEAYYQRLDREDPLAGERRKYSLPEDLIYFVGNSLGALPLKSRERLQNAVEEEWGRGLIKSWNQADWINLPQRLGNKIGQLIGAEENAVIVADSTSICLYKLIMAALSVKSDRHTIITETSSFPTDLYVLQGIVAQMSEHVQHEISLKVLARDAIPGAIDSDTALLVLGHVDYRTGELLDMKATNKLAQAQGALTLWDLCHSAGVIDVALKACGTDFAVGCGYKYLNGGPGAPAYLYVAPDLLDQVSQPLNGWMGHRTPFEFAELYQPKEGIRKMLTGTPPVLAAIALEGAVDTLLETDIQLIRQKSRKLGQLFVELMDSHCGEYGFTLVSPPESQRRGSQVCYRHEHGYEIMQALIARNVLGDYRHPGVIRFGFAPVYQRYTDIWAAVKTIKEVMEDKAWQTFKNQGHLTVT